MKLVTILLATIMAVIVGTQLSSCGNLTSSKNGRIKRSSYLGRATFVRWGRKDCPSNTHRVYPGFAGGSYYGHGGGAVDYLCMPEEPTWGPHKYVNGKGSAYLYGAEYEEPFDNNFYNHGVPCAVCIATKHLTSIMIPGRYKCYHGWTMAYRGDLASGKHDHGAASQYVCLDENLQSILGSIGNRNGKLFYNVVAKCGALPCPPYEDNKHLACVVCLK